MSNYDGEAVLEAIRDIQATTTDADAIERLARFGESYGFSRVYLGQLVNPLKVPLKDILYLSNWPEELKARRRSVSPFCMTRSRCVPSGRGGRLAGPKRMPTHHGLDAWSSIWCTIMASPTG